MGSCQCKVRQAHLSQREWFGQTIAVYPTHDAQQHITMTTQSVQRPHAVALERKGRGLAGGPVSLFQTSDLNIILHDFSLCECTHLCGDDLETWQTHQYICLFVT